MTETHATPQPEIDRPAERVDQPTFPPGRYGRRREPRRRRPWLVAVLVGAVIALGVIIALDQYRRYGDPAYDAQLISYTDITDTQIVVHFRVNLPADTAATCAVRARDHSGAEVGRAEVPVRPAQAEDSTLVNYRLATTARPFIGEVVRCRPAG